MFQGNHIWSLWCLYHRELNFHVDVENKRNWSIGCQEKEESLGRTWVGKNLFNEEVWGDKLCGQDNVLIEDIWYVDKRGHIFWRYNAHIIDLFLHILRLTTNMMRYFVKDMFKKYPSIVICDDVLEGFVWEGCGRTKYGVVDSLESAWDMINSW